MSHATTNVQACSPTSSQTNLDVAVCGSTDVDVSDAPGAPEEYGEMFPEVWRLARVRGKENATYKALPHSGQLIRVLPPPVYPKLCPSGFPEPLLQKRGEVHEGFGA